MLICVLGFSMWWVYAMFECFHICCPLTTQASLYSFIRCCTLSCYYAVLVYLLLLTVADKVHFWVGNSWCYTGILTRLEHHICSW